jgi:chemotaxis protein CheX
MRVEFINPFVASTCEVFRTMLGQELTRGALSVKREHTPMHEVSGLIGLSGMIRGMVVVSLSRQTALAAASVLLGGELEELNGDVLDAIGEITNMVAGAAKTRLAEYRLTIGLPTVICGKGQSITFPSSSLPLVIPFESAIGPLCVQVGMVIAPGSPTKPGGALELSEAAVIAT